MRRWAFRRRIERIQWRDHGETIFRGSVIALAGAAAGILSAGNLLAVGAAGGLAALIERIVPGPDTRNARREIDDLRGQVSAPRAAESLRRDAMKLATMRRYGSVGDEQR